MIVMRKLVDIFKAQRTTQCPLVLLIIGLSGMFACQQQEVTVEQARPGPTPIQLHNFNRPVGGGILDGTAPDIYYFRQKEDRYVSMLTYTGTGNFETNWATNYVLLVMNETGNIQKMESKPLPSKDGIAGTFEFVWEAPPPKLYPNRSSPLPINRSASGSSYVADEQGFLYYQPLIEGKTCFCKSQFFNLNPETGNAEFISVGTASGFPRAFRTSDGGFISVGWEGSPDFAKYSKSGTLQFRQPMKYWETRPSFEFLTERNGDFYFIALYNAGYSTYDFPGSEFYDPDANQSIFENFSENKAKSFFYLKDSKMIASAAELRFGPGKKQKAHRFDRYDKYQDYVEVPFEVWGTNDFGDPLRQVMVSFRDQDNSGKFELFPFKYDKRNEKEDDKQSREVIWYNGSNYSEIPDPSIMNTTFLEGVQPSFVWAYLTEGANWDPANLPSATFSQIAGTRPEPQLIKVNANGSSVVKENFALGSGVKFKSLYKAVPFLDRFAVLINAQQITTNPSDFHLGAFGYQPTQLVILDGNFNQVAAPSFDAKPGDSGHQLESNNNQFFYARNTYSPGVIGKNALLLSTVRDNVPIEQYVDIDVEKYRITPTKSGGVALLAWVRPTENTRYLLFMEFDENLKLITSRRN